MRKKVYGVSSKFEFNGWNHKVYVFENMEQAEEWLDRETYDFREREIVTKSGAIKLAGKKAVDEAEEGELNEI